MRVSQKGKGLFKKKKRHLVQNYRNETNITFQCNPRQLQRTGFPAEKRFLIESLTSLAPRQWLLHWMKIFFLLDLLTMGQKYGNRWGGGEIWTVWWMLHQLL
jgi:hypothetical protein